MKDKIKDAGWPIAQCAASCISAAGNAAAMYADSVAGRPMNPAYGAILTSNALYIGANGLAAYRILTAPPKPVVGVHTEAVVRSRSNSLSAMERGEVKK